jgi:hypothetical protein
MTSLCSVIRIDFLEDNFELLADLHRVRNTIDDIGLHANAFCKIDPGEHDWQIFYECGFNTSLQSPQV